MIQVMPLKPAGYLLKDSKPADLKKEIDAVNGIPLPPENGYHQRTARRGRCALQIPCKRNYEMPIVDGKQTLEMLRSEKSFEDTKGAGRGKTSARIMYRRYFQI